MGFKNYYVEALEDDQQNEINTFLKELSAGKELAYEALVGMVALVGKKPKFAELEAQLTNKEIPKSAKKVLKKLFNYPTTTISTRSRKATEKMVVEYATYIGRHVFDLPGGTPTSYILDNVRTSYINQIDDTLKDDGSKDNTVDIVFVYGGKPADVKKNMKYLHAGIIDDNLTNDGLIHLVNKNEERIGVNVVQVSLKKDEHDSQIGKITTYSNEVLGKRNIKPATQESNMECGTLLTEGMVTNWIKKTTSWVVDSIGDLINHFKKWALQVRTSFANALGKTDSKIKSDNLVKASKGIAEELGSVLNEGSATGKAPIVLTDSLKQNIDSFFNQVSSNHTKREFAKVSKRINKIDSICNKEGVDGIIFKGNTAKFYGDNTKEIKKLKKEWKSLKKKKAIPRVWIQPIVSLNANYIGYTYLVDLLDYILSTTKSATDVSKALTTFVSKASVEAVFGDTRLPLWKIYGGDTPAQYLGMKSNYNDVRMNNVIESSKKYPIASIIVEPIQGNKLYQKIEVYFLVGPSLDQETADYYRGIIASKSNVNFTIKWEINKKLPYEEMIRFVNK